MNLKKLLSGFLMFGLLACARADIVVQKADVANGKYRFAVSYEDLLLPADKVKSRASAFRGFAVVNEGEKLRSNHFVAPEATSEFATFTYVFDFSKAGVWPRSAKIEDRVFLFNPAPRDTRITVAYSFDGVTWFTTKEAKAEAVPSDKNVLVLTEPSEVAQFPARAIRFHYRVSVEDNAVGTHRAQWGRSRPGEQAFTITFDVK